MEPILGPGPCPSPAKPAGVPDDSSDGDWLCFACDMPVEKELINKYQKTRQWHAACWNSLHSLQRLCSADSELKKRVDECKVKDEVKYKAVLMSLATKGKYERTLDQRQRAKVFVQELVAELSVSRVNRCLLLPQNQYVAWYMHNESLTKEQAVAKWEEDKCNADIKKEFTEDGRLVCPACLLC